jgi:hypothetical protein
MLTPIYNTADIIPMASLSPFEAIKEFGSKDKKSFPNKEILN